MYKGDPTAKLDNLALPNLSQDDQNFISKLRKDLIEYPSKRVGYNLRPNWKVQPTEQTKIVLKLFEGLVST